MNAIRGIPENILKLNQELQECVLKLNENIPLKLDNDGHYVNDFSHPLWKRCTELHKILAPYKQKLSQKKYYKNNKNKILQKQKVKITCECGSIISKASYSKHLKSNKHYNNMEKIILTKRKY